MRNYLVILLCVITSTAFAADRNEKIRLLLDAQGTSEFFEQQLVWLDESRHNTIKMVNEKIMKNMNLNPGAEFKKKLERAEADFYKMTEPPWSIQDRVDAWAKYYGENFSDEEIDQLLAFYTSPVAKKDVIFSRKARDEIRNYFRKLYLPIMESGTNAYMDRLVQLIQECHCTNKP